jgi:hypothetical protein
MNKHTPGPWKSVHDPHYPGMMVVEGPEMPITIITSAIGVDFKSYVRRVANAHLIAAAPDLLAALEACESAMQSCMADFNQYDQAAYDAARAAIARAKGEQS